MPKAYGFKDKRDIRATIIGANTNRHQPIPSRSGLIIPGEGHVEDGKIQPRPKNPVVRGYVCQTIGNLGPTADPVDYDATQVIPGTVNGNILWKDPEDGELKYWKPDGANKETVSIDNLFNDDITGSRRVFVLEDMFGTAWTVAVLC
jgi:hypothetical protein